MAGERNYMAVSIWETCLPGIRYHWEGFTAPLYDIKQAQQWEHLDVVQFGWRIRNSTSASICHWELQLLWGSINSSDLGLHFGDRSWQGEHNGEVTWSRSSAGLCQVLVHSSISYKLGTVTQYLVAEEHLLGKLKALQLPLCPSVLAHAPAHMTGKSLVFGKAFPLLSVLQRYLSHLSSASDHCNSRIAPWHWGLIAVIG